MKERYTKGCLRLWNTKETLFSRISNRGASEMVAVVVLVVLVIAVAVLALPGVRTTLINSFRNITTGIDAVGGGS